MASNVAKDTSCKQSRKFQQILAFETFQLLNNALARAVVLKLFLLRRLCKSMLSLRRSSHKNTATKVLFSSIAIRNEEKINQ